MADDDDAGKGAQDERDAEELRNAARAAAGEQGKPDDDDDGSDKPGPVPYDRFRKSREELTAAQKRLAEFEAAEAKRRKDAMSASERTQAERDEAKREADEAKAELARAKRENVLYRAAVALGFADPDDAAVYLGSDESVTDADTAQDALKELLKRKPHLARSDDEEPRVPRSIGGPQRGTRRDDDDGDRGRPARRIGATDTEDEIDRTNAELGREIGEGLGFLKRRRA
jgi:hypothetical protein